jgi:hypothetical protein
MGEQDKQMKNALNHKLIPAALLLIGSFCAAAPAAAANGAPAASIHIALHKALYAFRLVSAEPGAGLDDVSGKLYFEQDATCDAWSTEHRMTTVYQYADTEPVTDADRYTAFETKDGQQFSFNADGQENGEETDQLRGSVEKDAGGAAKAVYSRPDGTAYDLPSGTLLPTAHTMEVIRHARAGDHFFSAVMFDGTDADGPVEIGTFIGKKATAEELKKIADSNKKIDAALMTPDAWHVRMAVFPLKDAAESLPVYEMDMVLHDNGVISHALVDYKSFVIEQNLTALEKLPAKKCP